MIDPFAELLADPGWADSLSAAEAAAHFGVLTALAFRLATRMATSAPGIAQTQGSDDLLTLDQAASLIQKSAAWLRRQAAAGRIPCARRIGRSWRFPRHALVQQAARRG